MHYRFGPEDLHGLRVLIVEDEYLLAEALADIARARGAQVIGPASTLGEAIRAVATSWIDLAVLDINLDGEMSFAIADRLDAAGIPYVIATGYGVDVLPERFRGKPRLDKPFRPEALAQMMVAAATGRSDPSGPRQEVPST
jgi:DNA-binding response OmpR family regulator